MRKRRRKANGWSGRRGNPGSLLELVVAAAARWQQQILQHNRRWLDQIAQSRTDQVGSPRLITVSDRSTQCRMTLGSSQSYISSEMRVTCNARNCSCVGIELFEGT